MNRIAYAAAHAEWTAADARVHELAPWWPLPEAEEPPRGLVGTLERRAVAERNMRTALQMSAGDLDGFWDGDRWLYTSAMWLGRSA